MGRHRKSPGLAVTPFAKSHELYVERFMSTQRERMRGVKHGLAGASAVRVPDTHLPSSH